MLASAMCYLAMMLIVEGFNDRDGQAHQKPVALGGIYPVNTLIGYSATVQADVVQRAEDWFANITTMRADFTQIASDGSAAEGQIMMRRPSRLKITYDGVPALNLISTSVWLHVDQPDERRVTSYPISETPLSLILVDPVSLR